MTTTIRLTLTIPEGATTCEGCDRLDKTGPISGHSDRTRYWCMIGFFKSPCTKDRPQECLDAERKAKNA